MRVFLFILLFCTSFGYCQNPELDFQRLLEGNQRFIDGKLLHPNRDQERRDTTAIAQTPFAIIVACSDSRVSPEILFDAGIGDLFVVRIAGNVVGSLGLSSIGYALTVLGTDVILVLGHENCGAVNAVFEGKTKGIEPIAKKIGPAVKKSPNLEAAIQDNVRNVVNSLQKDSIVAKMMREKKLVVKGGYYDLTSGKVTILQSQ